MRVKVVVKLIFKKKRKRKTKDFFVVSVYEEKGLLKNESNQTF